MKRLAWVILASSAACGDSPSSSSAAFVEQVAKAICAYEHRCCTDAQLMARHGHTDVDSCVTRQLLALAPYRQDQDRLLSEHRIEIDPMRADACLTALATQRCDASARGGGDFLLQPACAVTRGLVPVGGACEPPEQSCVDHARCLAGAAQWSCVGYQAEGEACNLDSDCDPSIAGLYCARVDFSCQRRVALGGACLVAANSEEPLRACVENTRCSGQTQTCVRLPGSGQRCLPVQSGDRCDLDPVLRLSCVLDQTADGSLGEICRGPGTLHELCGPGAICDVNLTCDSTQIPAVCTEPREAGEDCGTSSDCRGDLYCGGAPGAQPTCLSKKSSGSPCAAPIECLSASCQSTVSSSIAACQPEALNPVCVGRT